MTGRLCCPLPGSPRQRPPSRHRFGNRLQYPRSEQLPDNNPLSNSMDLRAHIPSYRYRYPAYRHKDRESAWESAPGSLPKQQTHPHFLTGLMPLLPLSCQCRKVLSPLIHCRQLLLPRPPSDFVQLRHTKALRRQP